MTNEEAERKCRENQNILFKCSSMIELISSIVPNANIPDVQTKVNMMPNDIEANKKSEITTLKAKWQTLKFNLSQNETLACIPKAECYLSC
jgi:hypothetical protein